MRNHGFWDGNQVTCEDLYKCFGLVAGIPIDANFYCPFCAIESTHPDISPYVLEECDFSFRTESEGLTNGLTNARFTRYFGSVAPIHGEHVRLLSVRDLRYLYCHNPQGLWYLHALRNLGTAAPDGMDFVHNIINERMAAANLGTTAAPLLYQLPGDSPFLESVGTGSSGTRPAPDPTFLPCHCNRCS